MEISQIRKLVSARPFKPIVFHLDNGEEQLITHPEIIVTEIMIIAVDDVGEPVYIAPEAISAIRHPRGIAARRRSKRVTAQR